MEADAGFWAAAAVAAMLVGLSKGGLPVVGMLAVPLLALFMPPVAAAGLLLPVYVASDAIGLIAYRRHVDRAVLLALAPAATLGVALGWATASLVSDRAVAALVGTIGCAFALSLILRRGQPRGAHAPRVLAGHVWGALTGFTSFVSHAGAPPYQVYVLPLGLEKSVYAGTTTVFFAYVNAIKLVPYWELGQLSPGNLRAAALLALPAALAVLVGVKLVRVIPHELFFRLVTWALMAVSLKLVWDAAFSG